MLKIRRVILLMIIDAILVAISIYFSYQLRFDFDIRLPFIKTLPYVIPLYVILTVCGFYLFKIYKRIWQYASIGDLISILKGVVLGSTLFFIIHQFAVYYFYSNIVVPRSIYALSTIISFLAVGGSRLLWRIMRDNYRKIQPHHRKALIIGAGEAGIMVVREMKHGHSEFYPVAFIDDDPSKQKYEVMGIPVVGTRHDILKAVKQFNIEHIVVALPSASRVEISKILNICKETSCQIKIMPRVNDLINGKISISTIRDVSVEDLLGREPVKVDMDEIIGYVKGESILVTGAGGSIGSEICRQVAKVEPKELIIFGHGENSIYDIEMELKSKYPQLQLRTIIGDVQELERVDEVFREYQPQVVFHAAAHKHVPLMEANPSEAVRNNVFGTKNVAESAHRHGTKRFVLISTDKAVNPTSVMGVTKRIAEMIVQDLNKSSPTIFAAVRFGNVLGSRGSVIPVFKKQIEAGGPVTVTHPDMVRYFMTIPEAVQLVIQAGAIAEGGEVFILDMGNPVRIADLAHDLIRLSGLIPDKDIKIEYSGIRPGEKLFEELLSKEEGASATKHDRIFVGKPLQISSESFEHHVSNLQFMSGTEEVKKQLKALVPSYQNSDSLNKQDQMSTNELLQASLELVASLDNNIQSKESAG